MYRLAVDFVQVVVRSVTVGFEVKVEMVIVTLVYGRTERVNWLAVSEPALPTHSIFSFATIVQTVVRDRQR